MCPKKQIWADGSQVISPTTTHSESGSVGEKVLHGALSFLYFFAGMLVLTYRQLTYFCLYKVL